jgi:hypothetical protein
LYGAGFSFDVKCLERVATISTARCSNIKDPVQFTTHFAYVVDECDDKLHLLSEAAVTAWSSEQKMSVFAVGHEFTFYAGNNSHEAQS